MKSMATNFLMTAAALALATGIASAQQYRADIPFAFHAGDATLPSGNYTIHVRGEQHYIMLANNDERRSALLMTLASNQPSGKAGDEQPMLTFVCGTNRCSLAQLRTGSATPSLMFRTPRPGKDEPASATWIRTVKLNGD
jgi:hypothetical protein